MYGFVTFFFTAILTILSTMQRRHYSGISETAAIFFTMQRRQYSGISETAAIFFTMQRRQFRGTSASVPSFSSQCKDDNIAE